MWRTSLGCSLLLWSCIMTNHCSSKWSYTRGTPQGQTRWWEMSPHLSDSSPKFHPHYLTCCCWALKGYCVLVLHCDLVWYLRASCSQTNTVFWESVSSEEEELLSRGTARYFVFSVLSTQVLCVPPKRRGLKARVGVIWVGLITRGSVCCLSSSRCSKIFFLVMMPNTILQHTPWRSSLSKTQKQTKK